MVLLDTTVYSAQELFLVSYELCLSTGGTVYVSDRDNLAEETRWSSVRVCYSSVLFCCTGLTISTPIIK